MHRAPLALLAAYLLGLWLGRRLEVGVGPLVAMGCAAGCAWLQWGPQKRQYRFLGLGVVLLVLLGYWRFTTWEAALPGTLVAGEVTLAGRVVGEPTPTPYGGLRLVLSVQPPHRGRVEVLLPRWDESPLRPGDALVVEGMLTPLDAPTNPHEPDRRLYRYQQGIYWQLRAARQMAHESRSTISLRERWRRELEDSLQRSMPSDSVGLMLALLLGDRSGLDPPLYQAARRAGIAHLFAVSGLHVGMVGACASYLVTRVGLPRMARLAGVVAIGLYGGLCGPSASVVRASLMYALSWLLKPLGGASTPLWSLCSAAGIILLVWPFWLFTVGFQLSFGAVLGIALWASRLQAQLSRLPWALRVGLATSLAVQLATLPVLAVHFGEISLVGTIINVVAMPLALAAVVGGLVVSLTGLVWSALAGWGGQLLAWLLVALSAVAHLGSQMPGAAIRPGGVSTVQLVAYYGALGLAFSRMRRPRRWWLACLVLLVCLPQLVGQGCGLEVVFFDVGHGDAILIRVIGGPSLLVDAGPSPAGERCIIPYLQAQGVRRLDVVVLTHAHDDHYGGAAAILQTIPCRLLLVSRPGDGWPPEAVVRAVHRGGGQVQAVRGGDSFRLGELGVRILHPPEGFTGDANDSSVVLHVTYGSWSILLTGDISRAVEEELVRQGVPLTSQVLKVAHHGSATSSSQALLQRTQAAHAVIQSGGRFGHPADTVLQTLAASGMRVWCTDQHGAITMHVCGRAYRVSPFRVP